jgi:DNA (cytosine-5)-methyltransferase 1
VPRKPTFVSLFSGCGGLDLGFEQAGFRGLGAFDIDPTAVNVHNSNLRTPGVVCDLSDSGFAFRLDERPDVVTAGSPCQGFSTLGKGRGDDPRNALYVRAASLAVKLKPQVVVLENVAGILSRGNRGYVDTVESLMCQNGYWTTFTQVACTHFGLPQIRRRVLLIACKRAHRHFAPPSTPATSLRFALRGAESAANHEPKLLNRGSHDFSIASHIKPFQKLCNVRGGPRAVPTWLIPEVFGPTTATERRLLTTIQHLRRRLRQRPFGDADPLGIKDINKHFGRNAHGLLERLCSKGFLRRVDRRFDLAHTFNGKYRRLSWDHPAPAVDTRFGEPRYFLHPEEHRGMSVREAARIQGFPDCFLFDGPRSSQYRMVGNAVPPPMARALASSILDSLL